MLNEPSVEQSSLRQVYRLLSVNRRLLKLARECEFADVEVEIRAEIEKLKALRRLMRPRARGHDA